MDFNADTRLADFALKSYQPGLWYAGGPRKIDASEISESELQGKRNINSFKNAKVDLVIGARTFPKMSKLILAQAPHIINLNMLVFKDDIAIEMFVAHT